LAQPTARVTRSVFLEDRQGKTFADVVNDPQQPFDVVRELESQPAIDQFLAGVHARRNARFR